jgi:hypothetical protein
VDRAAVPRRGDGRRAGQRFFTAAAEPVGQTFVLAANAKLPRLATNGSLIMLLYLRDRDAYAVPLTLLAEPTAIGAQKLSSYYGPYAVASNGRGFAAVTKADDGAPFAYSSVHFTEFDSTGKKGYDQKLRVENYRDKRRGLAVASDGTDYLVAILEDSIGGHTRIVNSNSVAFDAVPFSSTPALFGTAVSAVWTGSEYVLAFLQKSAQGDSLNTLRLAANGQPMGGATQVPVNDFQSGTSLLTNAGRVLLAWNPSEGSAVDELPSANPHVIATHGASVQRLLTSAFSANGSQLLVWSETLNGEDAIRIGLRTASGDWSERVLAVRTTLRAVAGSNGSEFMLAFAEEDFKTGFEDKATIYRIDAQGVPYANTSFMPFVVTDIEWTGAEYALIGYKRKSRFTEVFASTMDASGFTGINFLLRGVDATERIERMMNRPGFVRRHARGRRCADCDSRATRERGAVGGVERQRVRRCVERARRDQCDVRLEHGHVLHSRALAAGQGVASRAASRASRRRHAGRCVAGSGQLREEQSSGSRRRRIRSHCPRSSLRPCDSRRIRHGRIA